MPTLLDRLSHALSGEFAIERELGSGGMGVVFLAREISLERPVAIKVLQPELATAEATERFLREARVLANLSHPHILPIYRVGEAEGIAYFAMEYIQSGTLQDALARGPVRREDAVKLGICLLEALDRVHATGVLHRDIKPANIFIRGGRAVLGDFGIAKPAPGEQEDLTRADQVLGTPAYMAPEVWTGGGSSRESDVYAVGMVLYEALTGRLWTAPPGSQERDWRGVPPRLVPVLRRALQDQPAARWANAASFRDALIRAKRRRNIVASIGILTAVATLVFAAGMWLVLSQDRQRQNLADLAIVPFEVESGSDRLGFALAQAAFMHLENGFEGPDLTIRPVQLSARLWDSAQLGVVAAAPRELWRDLRALHEVRGRVSQRGDSLEVRITVRDTTGASRTSELLAGPYSDPVNLAFGIGLAIVRLVAPDKEVNYRGSPFRGKSTAAWEALIDGEAAFQHELLQLAEEHFLRALTLDSTLGYVWWRLYNVRRWRRTPFDIDLAAIYRQYADQFSDLDRLLIEADLANPGVDRLAKYARATREFGYDAYPWLLMGNELFHRGPLYGISLDSAVTVLDSATARNGSFAPAFSTLTWALIRLGRADDARRSLDRYAQIAAPITETDFWMAWWLQVAWTERFEPENAAMVRAGISSGIRVGAELAGALRLASSAGIPQTQFELGGALMGAAEDSATRVNVLEAQGLALMALGRVRAALVHFDSAGQNSSDPEFALQAAQWRVLLPIVGLPGVSNNDVDKGVITLEELAGHPLLGTRAAWTLAVVAYGTGDTATAQRWRERVTGPDSLAERLRLVLDAYAAEERGDLRAALRLALRVQEYDVGGRAGDPFVRALTHLERGSWRAQLASGQPDKEWLWYQNADWVGWLGGVAQAGEIDWAVGTYAAYLRAVTAAEHGDLDLACRLLPDVLDRWKNADPSYDDLVRGALDSQRGCS